MKQSFMACTTVLVLFSVVAVLVDATGSDPVKARTFNKNMKGDIIVLHAGSLRTRGNHPMGPYITSPAGCENICRAVPGCNGWTYCNKTSGCGSGCKKHAQDFKPLPNDPANPYSLPKNIKLSDLVRPGPFDSICHYSNTDRWNYGVCSLKKVSKPSSPSFWSHNTAEGWRSGTLEAPKECGTSIPAATCTKCLTQVPGGRKDQCLKCARTMAHPSHNPVTDTLIYSGQVKPNGCAACTKADVTSPSTCIDKCLVPGKKCGNCALRDTWLGNGEPIQAPFQPPPFDLQTCVDCTRKYGGNRFSACEACAGMARPKERSMCSTCMQKFTDRMCPEFSAYDADCIPQDACRACASIVDTSTCFACLARKPYNDDCMECTGVNTGIEDMTKCYKCAKDTPKPAPQFGGCARCMRDAATAGAQPDMCMSCVKDAGISGKGREWCASCSIHWYTNTDGQQKCVKCLKDNPADTNFWEKCSHL